MFAGPKKSRALKIQEQLLSPNIQRIALPVLGYIFILFFLLQGPIFFGKFWDKWETITIIYALFLIPTLILSIIGAHPFDIPAWKSFAWFGVAAIGAGILFKLVFSGVKYDSGFPVGALIPTALFQIFVITYAEESLFRGFLLEVGQRRGTGFGVLLSAIMFSIFHLAAYSAALGGLNFSAFGVAFIMGGTLGFVYLATRDFAGIGVVWGIHVAWNLVLLFG